MDPVGLKEFCPIKLFDDAPLFDPIYVERLVITLITFSLSHSSNSKILLFEYITLLFELIKAIP